MKTGIDYGLGKTNIDTSNRIRFGVINQNEIGQSWYDDSEAEYGKPCCPHCDNELDKTEEYQLKDEPVLDKDENEIDDEYYCSSCEIGIDGYNPDIYPDEPLCHYVINDEYKAHCSDYDIFIEKSPYYTLCQYCSPCAPGAGSIMNEGSVKAYCFGHDWFEEQETDTWIDCQYCKGTGLRNKKDYADTPRFTSFDDSRFYCPCCEKNEKYGNMGKIKKTIQKAPYKVYSVETRKEVLPG